MICEIHDYIVDGYYKVCQECGIVDDAYFPQNENEYTGYTTPRAVYNKTTYTLTPELENLHFDFMSVYNTMTESKILRGRNRIFITSVIKLFNPIRDYAVKNNNQLGW